MCSSHTRTHIHTPHTYTHTHTPHTYVCTYIHTHTHTSHALYIHSTPGSSNRNHRLACSVHRTEHLAIRSLPPPFSLSLFSCYCNYPKGGEKRLDIHAHTHTHIYTYIHTHTNTHTQTHTHTHTAISLLNPCSSPLLRLGSSPYGDASEPHGWGVSTDVKQPRKP
jgi:hypothetical protein